MDTVAPTSLGTFPYCNVAMDTGVIPPLPAGSTLVQAQVLIRHGARVPCSYGSCWPGDDRVFNCNATLLEGANSPPPGDVLPSGSVLFAATAMKGRGELRGNCMLGQLTAGGVSMQRANGRNLRAAYGAILPDTPVGRESSFFLRSDDCPRTIASGQALFSGMYPDVPAQVRQCS
jgi:hypothetical protein